MKRTFRTIVVIAGILSSVLRLCAVPVGNQDNSGFAPPELPSTGLLFEFTDKGTLPTLPQPMLAMAAGHALAIGDGSTHYRFLYRKTGPNEARVTTFVLSPDGTKQDIDAWTFESPSSGHFENLGASGTKGTFTLFPINEYASRLQQQAFCKDLKMPKLRTAPWPTFADSDDFIFSEVDFRKLFDSDVNPLSKLVLAYLYESRVAEPDYQTLTSLFYDFRVVEANNEFERRRMVTERRKAMDAKMAKAYKPQFLVFRPKSGPGEYVFDAKGYRCIEGTFPVVGVEGYGINIINQDAARYFKIPADKAENLDFQRRAYGAGHFTFYAIVDSVGTPTPAYPKVINVRVIAVTLNYGKWFAGAYLTEKGTFSESFDPGRDFREYRK